MSGHPEYWVHCIDGHWAVRHNGETVSTHGCRDEAVDAASGAANANAPSVLVICRADTSVDDKVTFGVSP